MSKKDKKKFRKRIRAQILSEMSQQNQDSKDIPYTQPIKAVSDSKPQKKEEAIPKPDENSQSEQLGYIKKDLKKSAIIIASMIILMVVLTIVDTKFDLLSKTGDQIFNFFGI